MAQRPHRRTPDQLRSRLWFDNPDNPGMTALYLERYLNYGLTRQELQSGKPIIGIAQTGSDLSPCNRHHLELAKRVRDGITAAGGVAFRVCWSRSVAHRRAISACRSWPRSAGESPVSGRSSAADWPRAPAGTAHGGRRGRGRLRRHGAAPG